MQVQLDPTFTLDSERHALIGRSPAGEIFFRTDESGLHVNIYSFTVRGESYSADGQYGSDGALQVYDVRKTDWTAARREGSKATCKLIREEVLRLFGLARDSGHLGKLERASEEWRMRDALQRLERERAELQQRLKELSAEHTAISARLTAQGVQ